MTVGKTTRFHADRGRGNCRRQRGLWRARPWPRAAVATNGRMAAGSCDVMWQAPTAHEAAEQNAAEMRMSQVGPYDEELALIEEEQETSS